MPLKHASLAELDALAQECRRQILQVVSKNGGHLASNLGAVELIIALHRVFQVEDGSEPVIFDVGHQSYTHKLLSGRADAFSSLRQAGGMSGFPSPAESPADLFYGGHTGSALSSALGLATARASRGDKRKVIAFLGDASLNNGATLEALNLVSRGGGNLIIVLNDNQMSISRNVGGVSKMLLRLISGRFYNRLRRRVKEAAKPHRGIFRRLQRINDLLKGMIVAPGVFFEELGIRYFGPVAGNDFKSLLPVLETLREVEGPVLLHSVTCKGQGYEYAVQTPEKYHGVAPFNLATGEPLEPKRPGFSAAFAATLTRLAGENDRLVAVTPAMTGGTGLSEFRRRYPERFYDVGIAEEHAVVFASGLAKGGMLPVLAGYASFMQRGLDRFYTDWVLNGVRAVAVLDRSGAVEDGPTHHGFYDLPFLRSLPGLTVLMPSCENELAQMLEYAVKQAAGPVILRYPRGGSTLSGLNLEPVVYGKAQVIDSGDAGTPVLWSSGVALETSLEAARLYAGRTGKRCAVINARFLSPFDTETEAAFAGRPAAVIEDGCGTGGLFSALAEARSVRGESAALRSFNWGSGVVPHGDPKSFAPFTAGQIADCLIEISG